MAGVTMTPNRKAFKQVCKDLETEELTLAHIGSVFGEPFWIMIVSCFLDSQDAARAIQGAMNRLKEEHEEITM